VLARAPAKLLVLGDMGELGRAAITLHAEAGEFAREAGIDRLLTLELSAHASRAFGAGARHFTLLSKICWRKSRTHSHRT
jgi:UDP-N-acetylmuramoyl-tripeptide--D-alanyl-D-alanine ligase